MDFLKIQQNLKNDEHDDIEQMTMNFELMIANAKAHDKVEGERPQIYEDACEL